MEKPADDLALTLDSYKKYYSEFIELAAHDLHAPLRKLTVLTERLLLGYQEAVKPETQQYITRISACLNDMRSLVDGLTDLAAATPDAMHYSPCDLTVIVQHILKEMQPMIKEKKAIITVGSLPMIEADTRQCRLLFRSLLDNAIRYSRQDTQVLANIEWSETSTEEKHRFELPVEKKYYTIEITDNGIGFDELDEERIFRPFVRLHGKSSYAGNGLNLATCKRVTENHKGVIYTSGNENAGACFTVLLPEKP